MFHINLVEHSTRKESKKERTKEISALENSRDWLKTIVGPMVDSLLASQMGQMADGTFNALPLSEFSVTVNVFACGRFSLSLPCSLFVCGFYFPASLGNSYIRHSIFS